MSDPEAELGLIPVVSCIYAHKEVQAVSPTLPLPFALFTVIHGGITPY